jgi:type IV pilus assembly protein PilW
MLMRAGLPMHRPTSVLARRQRGLSLVEMMVGVAIGLFIVAGATLLAGTQLGENRRLLLETQVQQDLRAASDIVTRELRRAGYSNAPEFLMWSSAKATAAPAPNVWLGLAWDASTKTVSYNYYRYGSSAFDFAFRLNGGKLQQAVGGAYQDLTDSNTLNVVDFSVTRTGPSTVQVACPKLCSDGTQNCWPTLDVNDYTIAIKGQAKSDASVEHTFTSRLRLRNDGLQFNVSASQVCP